MSKNKFVKANLDDVMEAQKQGLLLLCDGGIILSEFGSAMDNGEECDIEQLIKAVGLICQGTVALTLNLQTMKEM